MFSNKDENAPTNNHWLEPVSVTSDLNPYYADLIAQYEDLTIQWMVILSRHVTQRLDQLWEG